MKDILINKRFRVDHQIAVGGFGMVYQGTDLQTGDEVAIKLQYDIAKSGAALVAENATLRTLAGGTGVPRVLWFGREADMYGMVQELMGPSIHDLLVYCRCKLSLKTVLMLADQALCRLRHMHRKGFVHRDLKPSNMALGTGRNGNTLYLLDFGLACRYSGVVLDDEFATQEKAGYGTTMFMSLRCHHGMDIYPRDDLESLGYVLLYLLQGLHGLLPWAHLAEEEDPNITKIVRAKRRPKTFCKGFPDEFLRYFEYLQTLRSEDKPDYSYLRRLFRNLFSRCKYRFDNVFDWTEVHLKDLHAIAAGGRGRVDEPPEGESEDGSASGLRNATC